MGDSTLTRIHGRPADIHPRSVDGALHRCLSCGIPQAWRRARGQLFWGGRSESPRSPRRLGNKPPCNFPLRRSEARLGQWEASSVVSEGKGVGGGGVLARSVSVDLPGLGLVGVEDDG